MGGCAGKAQDAGEGTDSMRWRSARFIDSVAD